MTVPRRHRPGRLALAALGLLVMQVWVLALPLLHAAGETPGSHAGPHSSVAAFLSACPLDCTDADHEHRGHDPAACASCHAGRLVATMARAVRLDVDACLPVAVEARTLPRETSDDSAPPRLRGPPTPSFLS